MYESAVPLVLSRIIVAKTLHQQRKTNLSHDGLIPAHVPHLWLNYTVDEFCSTKIGRADIEASKSNVAMNAWLPQASRPSGNFSDATCLKPPSSKTSISHPFAVCFHTENQNQASVCSMQGFRPRWARLRTPALLFDRCTAPVKLPAWHGLQSGSLADRSRPR